MGSFRSTLAASVAPDHHAELLELVKGVVAQVPEMAGRYGDEELDQLVRAFGAVIAEALEGSSRERRDLLVGSAVPAFVADGQTAATLARAAGTLAVAVSSSLLRGMPEDERSEAAGWLAVFFGEYTEAVVVEALRAEASL